MKKLLISVGRTMCAIAVLTLCGCAGGGGVEVAGLPSATITATTPPNKATAVPPNSMITATFSKAMFAQTFTPSTFYATSPAGPLTGVVNYSGYTATLQLSAAMPQNTLITATITTGIEDNAGRLKPGHAALPNNFVWTFTTGTNDVPPTVLSTIPAALATGVSPSTSVSATFNKAMNAASLTTSTFTLTQGASGPANRPTSMVPATVTYANDVVTLAPTAPLLADTVYTATVTTGALDLDGTGLAKNWTWTFTTAPADIAPTVVSTIPLANATGVSPSSKVSATFSEAMNPATISGTSFTLTGPNSVAVPATVTYANDVAVLDPTSALIGSTVYTATVNTGVTDVAGTHMVSNSTWTFTTASTDVAPTVVSTVPAATATGVSLSSKVLVTFSESMKASTISTTTITLTGPNSTGVPATVTYANDVATLVPTVPLTGSSVYTGLVTTGVQDVAGTALASNYTWTFTTAPADIAPTVVSTVPAALATGVAINSNVIATFSEAMNAASITGTTFTLTAPGGVAVSANVTYANDTATLTPSPVLKPNTVYTATVTTGVSDVAGTNMVANKTWTFTTDVPPTITAVSPLNLATQVPVGSTVTATFSEALNPASVSGSTFNLAGPGGVAVPATVSYANDIATLTPTSALVTATKYTATVTTGIKDAAGTPLASSKIWTFTTGQAPINLGTARTYGVLGGSTVTNSGPTNIVGNVGVSPGTAVTGFPPGTFTGVINAGNPAAATAKADLLAGYTDAASRLNGNALPGSLAGLTITPGLYTNSTSVMLPVGATVTFDAQGNANEVFILQMGSTLTTGVGSNVVLINGAQAGNIYWSVGSSATLGVNSSFSGIILASASITANTGTTVQGLLLTNVAAVTLASNTITVPPKLRKGVGGPAPKK